MEIRSILREFEEIAKDPVSYLKTLDEQGKNIVLYTCSYVPEEVIWAFGFHPVRILGISETQELSNSHLQPYCCPAGKAILEDILSRKLPAAHVVFSNTCDTMQRISDIVRLNTDLTHFDFMVPARLDSSASKKYMEDQIINLVRFMEEISPDFQGERKDITEYSHKMSLTLELFEKIRTTILELTDLFKSIDDVTNKDIHNILFASYVMDREDFAKKIGNLLNMLKDLSLSTSNKKRIILTGSICCFSGIYEILDNAGAKVVYDDLCSGIRPYQRQVELKGNWISAISHSLLKRPICAAKYMGPFARFSYLKELIGKYNAQGIIFMVPKFCDPHLFDFPDMKKEINIPILLLETNEKNQIKGPEKTRIEAFLETI